MTILFQVDKFLVWKCHRNKKIIDPIYQKISAAVPELNGLYAPHIYKINKLKKECCNTCTQLSNARNLSWYFRFSADSLALAV